jgi:hypothetical protein
MGRSVQGREFANTAASQPRHVLWRFPQACIGTVSFGSSNTALLTPDSYAITFHFRFRPEQSRFELPTSSLLPAGDPPPQRRYTEEHDIFISRLSLGFWC